MPTITAVRGDITSMVVDAIVNAASTAMRGGGGVDGAIHRVGGPAILRECVARFPNGLATGDAGWTTAGALPARWVIHTVGPNYAAGERDRTLLESCYRRALEVADDLGVETIAFPLISTGIFGWPRADAIAVAVATIAAAGAGVAEVRLVAFDQVGFEELQEELARRTPIRILQAVQVLHRRGFQGTRVLPGMSASGMYWRVSVTPAPGGGADRSASPAPHSDPVLKYTTGSGTEFAEINVNVATRPEEVADAMLAALPALGFSFDDPAYVRWYDELMSLVEQQAALPIAYADYFDDSLGWEIGWGSGLIHPPPPTPPDRR